MKVLIIDDYEGTAVTLQKRFKIMNHDADYISEGKKALDFCNTKEAKKYDCFLVDLYLNGISGIDIYNALKIWGVSDKVIFITGCDGRAEIFQKAVSTKQPVVMKKFNSKDLIHSIEKNDVKAWAIEHMRSKGVDILKYELAEAVSSESL